MEILSFESHEDLASYMCYHAQTGKTVYTVLFYEDAKELLKELLNYEETYIDSIEISDPLYSGYDKEYYVILDSELKINVEKAFHEKCKIREDEFYYSFGDPNTLALIDSNANSLVIKAANDSHCAEIEIDSDIDDYDDYCDHDVVIDEEFEIDLCDFIEYLYNHMLED